MSTNVTDGLKQFLDTVAELDRWVDAFPGLSEHERGEGHAYIAGVARAMMTRVFLGSDPDRPRLVRSQDAVSRWGLDNPDNIYVCADIRGDTEYLIRGERGTCVDLAFEVLAGMAGDDGQLGSGISSIDVGGLQVEADGSFEIQVGGEQRGGNYLATAENATAIFVRHTSADWTRERAGWLTIEKVSAPTEPAPRPNPEAVSRQWALAAKRLRDVVMFLDRFGEGWIRQLPANEIAAPSTRGSGFLPGQYNTYGRLRIDDGMALIISVKPAACRYWSIATSDYRWMCTYDFRHHRNSLNGVQARLSSDGLFHLVLGPDDPGIPNWIDTAGHRNVLLFGRWQGVAAAAPELTRVALVPLKELRAHLPADEPTVDAAERARDLALRGRMIDKRFY